MAYKTLRNIALKDAERLIKCDYNGAEWYTDGYFATAYPIFDGYRMRKDQTMIDQKPDLEKVIPRNDTVPATVVQRDENDFVSLCADGETAPVIRVQGRFYDLLMALYPAASVQVDADGYQYAPVKMFDNDKLVAVIMPLKTR